GDEVLEMGPRALSDLRGGRVAMIFQEPATAFDPVFTIGRQIAETIRRHTGKSESDAWKRARELLEMVRIPSPAQRLKAYPHEMVDAPQHPYSRGLLASTVQGGMRGQRLEAIPGAPPDLGTAPTACSFAPRCRLAEPRCVSAPPPLAAVGEGHQVRCVLAA